MLPRERRAIQRHHLPSPPFFLLLGTRLAAPTGLRTTWTASPPSWCSAPGGSISRPAGSEVDGFVEHLEVDLAERGWLLDAAARAGFATLDDQQRMVWADWLLATLDADVGADRPHVPLFRRFPESTPASTEALYVDRVLAFLLQEPDQPCVLCGREESVAAVSPCGHLVCRRCFDGRDYTACPICHRRLDPDDPFLQLEATRWRRPLTVPLRMRRVVGRADRLADAIELRDDLVTRSTPLTSADRGDLQVLMDATTEPGDLAWLPDDVPVRETLAAVLAMALGADAARAVPQAQARWTTATDVARTLWAFSGEDPGLVLPARARAAGPATRGEWLRPDEPTTAVPGPRVGPLPRPVRRAALTRLDSLDLQTAVEDVLRHPTVWKRLGERLHPFEQPGRHPRAAVCFAALRGSAHPSTSVIGRAILDAGAAGAVDAVAEVSAGSTS